MVGQRVFQYQEQDAEWVVQPHLIRQTTLDGVLQSILVALTRGGREVREVVVPISIKEPLDIRRTQCNSSVA